MIVKAAGDQAPRLHPTVRLAENVTLVGDVCLAEDVNIWYGAVLRGDAAPIVIGRGSNVQDNCVLHCSYGVPTVLGENVTVGHGAILHSCTVEDGALIGMGATVLDGAVIGAGAMVAAGALVGPGKIIPPGALVVGVPGKVARALTPEQQEDNLENARHYVLLGTRQLDTL